MRNFEGCKEEKLLNLNENIMLFNVDKWNKSGLKNGKRK